ncbi:amino acid/polyamine/organocation transporter, APC superfamily [Muriicola jejuensis]|uniref:Arginine/agmatine antiporter n=1 Tax=Muriicola jejuensis TaxID=504488 RepID=A0A6P0UAT6_9FLAO|nr:amino acid permease [Muriicola jejuensis]NER09620.1 amino acid permease [Muriicola jejuensis]SMP07381.1 amino acid/polyamine/organocation transporter, APC superfamily [Muriicola jejuensis]
MSPKSSKGKLGIWMATSLVIGNMIGAGIFMMPAALAEYGGISILGWLASSMGALLLALVFSKLSNMVRNNNGGPYAFAREGFGDYVGFMVAWGYWIAVWTAVAALSIAFVSALSIFFPVLNHEPVVALMTGLSAIWFLTWVNSRGVRSSGKMQVLTTILKLSPILVIILGGFFFFKADNFIPFNASDTSSFNAIAITGTMTLYAFLGLECATIPADNVKDPEKTIPRATLLGTLITTAVYILSTVAVMGLVPLDELTNSPAPFADAMKVMTGETGSYIVAGGAAIAAFGALNGWILIQSQLARAISRDGLFPKIFQKENSNGVPVWGIVIGSALSSLVMLMNYSEGLVEQFKFIILLSTLCTLVPYLFSASAYVTISLERNGTKKTKTGIFVLGSLTFAYSLWAVFGAGEKAVFWGFILLLAGTPFYVWLKWKNKSK